MEGVRAAKADFDAAIIETGLDRLTPELVAACQERDSSGDGCFSPTTTRTPSAGFSNGG